MALSIVNNLASLNAQNSLSKTSASLNKSLERLSTGLKVNRGADGPAALVISEQQRAQIAGLQTAIDNTNKAVSVVQTAEGALNEVNGLLTKIRGLALDSANSGVNDSNALAANQAEITNALNTISNIASTTKFGTKNLLDGHAGINATIVPGGGTFTGALGGLKAGSATPTGNLAVAITQGQGSSITGGAATGSLAAAGTLTISGGGLSNSLAVSLSAGDNATTAASKIQNALDTATNLGSGVGTFAVSTDYSGAISIRSNILGSGAITVKSDSAGTATVTGFSVAGQTSNANSTTTFTGAGAVASTGIASGDDGTLTIQGGGLTGAVTVNLAHATENSDVKVLQKIQSALDNATAQGGGTGKFTVTQTAGSAIIITSNVASAGKIQLTAAATNSANTGALVTDLNLSAATSTGGSVASEKGASLAVTVNGQAATINAGASGLNNAVNFGGANGLNFNLDVRNGGTAPSGTSTINVANNSLNFQIGANAGETAAISIDKVTADRLGSGVTGLSSANTTDLSKIDVTTTAGAQDAIKVVDQAIGEVSTLRGKLGAFQSNTLESNSRNLSATLQNTTAAESVIRDTDFASEIANFTRLQTQVQAGSTVLGNANQTTQLVAQLLRG